MRGRIRTPLFLVARFKHQSARDQDGTDGHFAQSGRLLCKHQRALQMKLVA